MRVVHSQIITDQDVSETQQRRTHWQATWDTLWYFLVSRFHQRSHATALSQDPEGDRWNSDWKPLSFKITTSTLVIDTHHIYPRPIGDAHLFLWERFRKRLIAVHKQIPVPPSPSQAYLVFLYALGLKGGRPDIRRSQPGKRMTTPYQAKPIPPFKKNQKEQQSHDRPIQKGLWDQDL